MNRALLVGINAYPGNELNGCINDVTDMATFLTEKCGFESSEIRLLTDARATTERIKRRLGWLMTGLNPGDRVLFHYSGHGAQVATRNPQGEVDGLDEVICPVDFDWTDQHMIRDKDFHSIFSNIPEGVKFMWVSDSCHSGDLSREIRFARGFERSKHKTILPPADLSWRLRVAKDINMKVRTIRETSKQLNLALISGCRSDQTSADAFINGRYNGALTRFLLDELMKPVGLNENLVEVVENINNALDGARYDQDPQLEGNENLKNLPFLYKGKTSIIKRVPIKVSRKPERVKSR